MENDTEYYLHDEREEWVIINTMISFRNYITFPNLLFDGEPPPPNRQRLGGLEKKVRIKKLKSPLPGEI
jgi:hypothetical protein